VQLFNLTNDVAEKDNLIGKYPDKAAELQKSYDAWNAQMVPPKWKTARRRVLRRLNQLK
jgi:hypothetical protein